MENSAINPGITQNIFPNVRVATDEAPSPKFSLSDDRSREKIESLLLMSFELGHCNHQAMAWALKSLDPVDY